MKKFALAVAVVVAVFVVVVSIQPSVFTVERSAVMAASPDAVFDQVNQLQRWPAWSPWAAKDPDMKQTYAGPDSGVGASSTWAGNQEVGEGRMTIVASEPGALVRIRLEFLKPFESVSESQFVFLPAEGGTLVTWTMTGQNNFAGKAFSLLMDMDAMVGGDFEKGLASLKALVESRPAGP